MTRRNATIAVAAVVAATWYIGAVRLEASTSGAGRGEGGIVLGDHVPVYASATSDRQIAVLAQRDAVAALASLSAAEFYFVEANGRVQVLFFAGAPRARERYGWVEFGQLARFTYDCSCGADNGCPPTRARLAASAWNACFERARDARIAELGPTQGPVPGPTDAAAPGGPGPAAASTAPTIAAPPALTASAASPFTLGSPTFATGAALPDSAVFDGLDCHGPNVSPALEWKDPPAGTQGFALVMDDYQARGGDGFAHWAVYDIAATARSLPAHAGGVDFQLAGGARQAYNDFLQRRYGGPCPPPGPPHEYRFTLYALDLPVIDDAGAPMTWRKLRFLILGHVLGEASLSGWRGR